MFYQAIDHIENDKLFLYDLRSNITENVTIEALHIDEDLRNSIVRTRSYLQECALKKRT